MHIEISQLLLVTINIQEQKHMHRNTLHIKETMYKKHK